MRKYILAVSILFFVMISGIKAQYASPESIIFDAASNRYIVSNAANGTTGGNLVTVNRADIHLVTSFVSTGVNSPKGMCISNDTLFVADVTKIKAFKLPAGTLAATISITGAVGLNDLVNAKNGFLYVTDLQGNKIYKIDQSTLQATAINDPGSVIIAPNGILLDSAANRLIFVSYRMNSPIQTLTLSTGVISTWVNTSLSNLDGIAKDPSGNYYISSWATNSIYKYNNSFSGTPTVIASGYDGPADILYNSVNDTLIIPCFNSADMVFLNMQGTGIESPGFQFEVSVLPNPAKNTMKVCFTLKAPSNVSISLFDIEGKCVKELFKGDLQAQKQQLDFNVSSLGLNKGVYLVRLIVGKEIVSKKIVIE